MDVFKMLDTLPNVTQEQNIPAGVGFSLFVELFCEAIPCANI